MNDQSNSYRQGVKAAFSHVCKKTLENWANEPTSSLTKVLVEAAHNTQPVEVCKAEGRSPGSAEVDFMNGVRAGLGDLQSIHVS